VTGVVLAGGRSVRFGSDKLAEPYRGMPLLQHAVIRLVEVCGEVVVVLSRGQAEPSLPPGVAVRIARDATEGEGPLGGALAGLAAVRTDLALIAAGDMPDLQVPLLREMLRVSSERPADAVALADGDRVRPLPAVVRPAPAVEHARALLAAGRGRLRDLLEALHVAAIEESAWRALDPGGRTLFDVDEPGDLSR
jgi:molybdopterin-guanine dinucleotide biosynthesis protein A